jgi:hypothetical protein
MNKITGVVGGHFKMTAMKQIIHILTLTLFLLGCSGKTKKAVDTKSMDTLQTIQAIEKQADIYIKDKSEYDPSFIDGLSAYKESIRLIGNYLVTGKDTIRFPGDLSLNKPTTFKATNGNNQLVLTVTRTNWTNLTYSFRLTDRANKTIDTKSGKAVLGSMFFLASEMDEDAQTGEGYGSYEYGDQTNNCWFSIRIGVGLDNNGKQRARLTYGCEDKPELKLDECPTLRTE